MEDEKVKKEREILFVGSRESGSFLLSYQKQVPLKIVFLGEFNYAKQAAEKLLTHPKSIYIIDATQFLDDSDQIADIIKKTASAMNSIVIILVPGYAPNTTLVQNFMAVSITSFIYGMSQGARIKELENILPQYIAIEKTSYGEMRDKRDNEEASSPIQDEAPLENKPIPGGPVIIPKISIGVAGSMERIGTTTQALQIVKYLQYIGRKAVFIEMNQGKYLEAVKQFYSGIQLSDDKETVTYQDVVMVPERLLGRVLKEEYEYYIYDYGNMNSPGFNRASYLEKDIQIVVCGSSPTELSCVLPVLMNPLYDDMTQFIFSFVDLDEREFVLEMMQERKNKTYFTSYTADPFVFTPETQSTYTAIIPNQPELIPEKKPKHFLPRFFKK